LGYRNRFLYNDYRLRLWDWFRHGFRFRFSLNDWGWLLNRYRI
jgi:hypothetical protein